MAWYEGLTWLVTVGSVLILCVQSPNAVRRESFMPDTKAQSKKTGQTKKEKGGVISFSGL